MRKRCKHGMFTDQCGICLRSKHQTPPSYGSINYLAIDGDFQKEYKAMSDAYNDFMNTNQQPWYERNYLLYERSRTETEDEHVIKLDYLTEAYEQALLLENEKIRSDLYEDPDEWL